MAYSKTPSHLWRKNPDSVWHFKLGIPAGLRQHYPHPTVKGKHKTHIVESLHTHSRHEAMRLKEPLLVKYREEFKRLAGGTASRVIGSAKLRVPEIRQALLHLAEEVRASGGIASDEHLSGMMHLSTLAEHVTEDVKREAGEKAAKLARRKMTDPEAKTLREALELYLATSDNKGQTMEADRLAVRSFLEYLGVPDCYPEDIEDQQVVAYVDSLNDGPLSKSTKDKRITSLNKVWKHMRRRGWPTSPWSDLQITAPAKRAKQGTSKATDPLSEEDDEDVRPFTDAEAIKVFTLPAPNDKRRRQYTRPLFRELYALGFTTGMRLNEIASLRPVDVEKLDETWRVVTITGAVAKTEAGARRLPVCHPVAVAILDARLEAQQDPKGRLFSECQPGGPDEKPSWHVGKAMSRERLDADKLGFSSAVNFHSTRRSFATLMENSTVTDNIGQQRYMGHDIPNQLNGVYSGGAGVEKLKAVVAGLAYPPAVEEAMRLAVRQPHGLH